MKKIVGLSGGKDSTALAFWLKENEPDDYEYICTPTGNELPEMIAWWKRLGDLLGKPIRPVSSGVSLAGLIRMERAVPNWRMRFCTPALKIAPFQRFVGQNLPCMVFVGIRADEADREGARGYAAADLLVTERYPFVEIGWGLAQVLNYLRCLGLLDQIPTRTDCAACFFQTLWEWYQLWLLHPDKFEEACRWEDMTGHTLRSDSRDTWPARLRDLAALFAAGKIPKRSNGTERTAMCSTCAR